MKGERRMYKALDIANYVVTKCTKDECPISNLQLQKILYYIQRYYLVHRDIPAFSDEIEAWQFGPVVPDVYRHFCGFGAMKINAVFEELCIKDADRKVIDIVVNAKKNLSPWDLVNDTHREGKAWSIIFKNGEGLYQTIPTELIRING